MAASDPLPPSGVPWQRVFDQASAPMAIMDLQGRYLYVNEAASKLLGYPVSELVGLDYRAVTHPDDVDLRGPLEADVPLEKRYIRSDGQVIWALVSRSFIRDDRGEPMHFLSQIQDITARREAELLWQRSFANAPIGMAVLDLKGNWTAVNDRLCEMLGYSRDELLGMNFNAVTFSGDTEQSAQGLSDLFAGRRDSINLEKRYRHREGHPIWVLIRATTIPGAGGEPAFVVSQYDDVGEERLVDAHLAHLALHDPLTGLANRALVFDRLDHARQQLSGGGRVLAVVVADLDHLKPVNDEHGHALGDQLLIAAARQMQRAVRAGDTVARTGGDEFAVVSLLPDESAAAALSDRIAQHLDTAVVLDGIEMRLSGSVGHATTTDPYVDLHQLVHLADRAMYENKRLRRDPAR